MDDVKPTDTVITRLRHWSITSPDKPAFIYATPGGTRLEFTRAQLYSLSCRAATWLCGKGVGRGDVVLCILPSSPEELFLVMGAVLLGATTVTYSIVFADGRDVINLMNLSDVTTIAVDARDENSISILKKHVPDLAEGKVACDAVPSLSNVVFCNKDAWNSRPSFLDDVATQIEAAPVDCQPDDVVVLWPTSGSTGFCKVVPRTHRDVLLIGQQSVEAFGARPGETVHNPAGFGWISGYPTQYLAVGITRVVLISSGSPTQDRSKLLWDFLCQEQPTAGFFKPSDIEALMSGGGPACRQGAWRARVMGTGSRPIKRKDLAGVLGVLTSEIRVVYGSTEAGFNLYKSYTDVSQVEDFNCGQTFLGQEVKVVDSDLQEVPVNTKGHVIVRNGAIFSAYLKQPEQTREMKAEGGWYRTGDGAYRNQNGDVFVVGRESDVIMINGQILYPQQLEQELSGFDGVTDVAIVGIPDEEVFNRPCICVVRDKQATGAEPVSSEDILRQCGAAFNQSLLGSSKEWASAPPKYCLFFDAFPFSRNGKLQRKLLRQKVLERLGIAE
ncbi:hypothetical protein BaRGS_00035886 [Batillaria attramentaria]|uniref:AMP-dependent synthetase/ligase domain-containing protein n=1 Tax=Batillaria attramentaria TaxID=370345 RepID=A0ABD0JD54_9CAEN